ncbi:hypothetical protein K3495_g10291 [Podosphaera aphanis]|nr:hypothetical protein K3495_g10291 [Podosphaera aphanis]
MSFLNLSPSPKPLLVFKTEATRIPKSELRKSTLQTEQEDEIMDEAKILNHVPKHPIPNMQGAFAESFLESTSGLASPTNHKIKSAIERRQVLLEQNATEETHAAKWKLKPGQQFHEFWKLMAQISFGVYLLLNGIARDEDQVMKILQVHVDEVDEFLEITLEDFSAAQDDIEERLKYLKLPLRNISTFDIMLEDRTFRRNIVEGNEKIEHIIARTALAMNDALKDVQQGSDACQIFTEYLAAEKNNQMWKEKPNTRKVYEAMKGNVDGWCKALASLQTKGNHLDKVLVQLGSIVAEIDRRAGEVSRKTRFSSVPQSMSSTPSLNSLSIHDGRSCSRQMNQSSYTGSKPNYHSTQANVPVTFESIPELEPDYFSDDSYLPEPDLLLKPHTYTPVPSPGLPKSKSATKTEPITPTSPSATAISRRSSLRKHFSTSCKRPPNIKEDSPNNYQLRQSLNSKPPNNKGSDNFRDHQIPDILTPPSRGSDSANNFGFDEFSPQTDSPIKKQNLIIHQSYDEKHDRPDHDRTPTPSSRIASHISVAPDNITYQNSLEPSPLLTPMTIKIPDQQYFRPVNASPHSPLQRPWTASPAQNPLHAHPNSSSSNLSNYSSYSRRIGSSRFHSQTPSTMRNLPSAMGMSVQSEMTPKELRKKRSMFGWLKDQFSLSEEEREAFEQKRRYGEIQRIKLDMTDRDRTFEERRRYNGNLHGERARTDTNRDRRK